MKSSVDLFTRPYEAELTVTTDGVHLSLKAEAMENLEEYLLVVLPSYVVLPEGELSLEQLLQIASEWQEQNPDSKLSEPITKLPYDVETEDKAKLGEISRLTGISQAQLLTQIVDRAYRKKVKGKK
jgi:hypothetical protein